MGNGGLEVLFPEEYLLSGFEHHGKKKAQYCFFLMLFNSPKIMTCAS